MDNERMSVPDRWPFEADMTTRRSGESRSWAAPLFIGAALCLSLSLSLGACGSDGGESSPVDDVYEGDEGAPDVHSNEPDGGPPDTSESADGWAPPDTPPDPPPKADPIPCESDADCQGPECQSTAAAGCGCREREDKKFCVPLCQTAADCPTPDSNCSFDGICMQDGPGRGGDGPQACTTVADCDAGACPDEAPIGCECAPLSAGGGICIPKCNGDADCKPWFGLPTECTVDKLCVAAD